MPDIVLLTDFGTQDPYMGIMKGVIHSIHPQARIIDLCHDIKFAGIRQASFYLEVSHKYFPPDTIFVTVVDPGVGGKRQNIAAKTEHGTFIAPDNGCLSRILHLYPHSELREISNRSVMLEHVSRTFHGRDIFAPAAAHLAKGFDFTQLGEIFAEPVTYKVNDCVIKENTIEAEVIHIDHFGNIITNISAEYENKLTSKVLYVSTAGKYILSKVDTFETLEGSQMGIMIGSSGYFEIVANQDSAASILNVEVGDKIIIELAGADECK